jgi:hypothetical protein
MDNLPDIRRAINLQGRIRSAAKALDRLGTGALVAFTGGAAVVGLVAGGILWMPAVMSGSLFLYRTVGFLFERRNERMQRRLEIWDDVLLRKKALYATKLPEEERKLLSSALDQALDDPSPRRLLLASPKDRNRAEGEAVSAPDSSAKDGPTGPGSQGAGVSPPSNT